MRADLAARERRHAKSLIATILVVAALIGLAILWMRIDWAWSPVDDAGHVLALQALTEESGHPLGMARYAIEMFNIDLEWGLFRPSYWLYPSLFYLLPTGPAHFVRLLMVFVTIAGPLVFFHRQGIRGAKLVFIGILLTAAGSALYIGLVLVSLQELSGMASISLGLMVRNRWIRWILWVVAAWFKAPFAWLLVGQAVADWRRGDRALAAANGVMGLGTLGLAVVLSRTGSYTATYTIDPYMIWFNAQNLLEPINVVILILVMWWLIVQQGRITWTANTTVFAIGWFGYTAQLLPWSVTAYYMGPISFLFALTMASMLHLPGNQISPLKALAGWSVPVVLATIVVADALQLSFRINNAMVTFQSCLANQEDVDARLAGSLVYVTTSTEAPFRLQQNLQLLDSRWNGSISLVTSADELDGVQSGDLLLVAGPSPVPTRDLELLCTRGEASVYQFP